MLSWQYYWLFAIVCCKDKLNNLLKQLIDGEKFVILPMRGQGRAWADCPRNRPGDIFLLSIR